MSEKCIPYPNDLNYLNDSGIGDVLLVRDIIIPNMYLHLQCWKGVNCLTVHKGLLWYTYE